jgi:hypothetical protein
VRLVSAHELTSSRTCTRAGCGNDAGDDGLCDSCRAAERAPKRKPTPAPLLSDPLGLTLEPGCDLATWTTLLRRIGIVRTATRFWVGDALDQGDFPEGEKFAIAERELGLARHHLKQLQWVARAVPRSRRRRELTHTHHRQVAALSPAEQERFLELAVAERLTTSELRDEIVAAGLRAAPPEAELDADPQAPATPKAVIAARPRLTATVTDPDRIDRWQAAAQARGWTITRLVEEAVDAYLAAGASSST